ncbi:MAG: GxxExxY protein [Planctomycetota bacterium]
MPVHAPLSIPRLSAEQFAEIDYSVMGVAFALHNELGCKWNEFAYQAELFKRLIAGGLNATREFQINISFGKFTKTYKVDLLVSQAGVYELKAVDAITKDHIGQVLNYLRLLNATRAKIVNFRPLSLESMFVNCSDTRKERSRFDIDSGEYRGPKSLKQQAIGMLRELGTKLSISLYNECLLANAGVWARPSSSQGGACSQKFQMVSDAEAFSVTAFESKTCHHREHLSRMTAYAGLTHFHWINVTPAIVRLETISAG